MPSHPEQVILKENCYRIYPDGSGGYVRGFFDVRDVAHDYALSRRSEDGRTVWIDYLPEGRPDLGELSNAFFHIGLESVLIREQKVCLHASLVETRRGGVLFAGPSGIGKSTQADLWCRFGGARQLNGDRPILGKKDGRWFGWGSPYAGSSHCYVNAGCPIAAVVLLAQAPQCALERVTVGRACRAVYEGLTVNPWDPAFSLAAFDLAADLAEAVPVWHFACTPDERAVDVLRAHILTKDI